MNFRDIVEHMHLPVWIVDENWQYTYLNKSAENFWGYSSNHLAGRVLWHEFPALVETIIYEKLHEAMRQRKKISFEAFSPINHAWYTINVSPHANGLVICCHDKTVEKMNIERLSNELSRLDSLNIIGEMAAGVAHEVRNPMTVIKGYLQMFRQKEQATAADTHKLEQYDTILEELERVETIISDFLSLARSKESSFVAVDLNALIKELSSLIFTDALKNDVVLSLNLAENLPPVLLDNNAIKQLILNMVRNGIDAIQGRGVLTIGTERQENTVILSVHDTGCGIPPSVLDNVFNPFFTTKETGTGLGLSVCKSIVERHGGKIEVESEPNKGTTFKIIFKAIDI